MLAARSLGRAPSRCHALLRSQKRLVATRAVQVDSEVAEASTAPIELPPSAVTDPPEALPARNYAASTSIPSAAAASSPVPPTGPDFPPKVADLDAQRFRLHPSVEYWQNFTSKINTIFAEGDTSFVANLQQLVRQASESAVLRDPRAASYWAYHTARMTFFIGQAATGLVAHHLSETLPSSITGLPGMASSGGGGGNDAFSGAAATTPFQRVTSNLNGEILNRVSEALATFQQDYDNICAGYYPMPWDMVTPGHRQYNPLFMLTKTAQAVEESVATLRRRVRGQPDHVWLSGSAYPQYYTKTYHYQTDGWMSERSARVYEHNTELLFFGRQDAMQRTSLLPLTEYLREAELGGRSVSELRLLEVAAGTGRFHTFIKDAHPALPTVVSDLSPFYLARARSNMRYWAEMRQSGRQLGGVDGAGVQQYLQTAAERIDARDDSFDILVCVYLFHELPEPVRRAAAAEFFRVLRPGGLAIITDSVQTGDRPAWDKTLGVFGDFNEPYYRNYISCDLGAMFEDAGFQCDTKYLCSASKTLTFRKPL
ncbi:hypothetical protein PLESTB_001020700 [Pleodorina starrii]|uniref:Methyltransferase domain-containing protein n=1 Tax=Pleodorina starrii TaxID=330485 RepID=A0A9W6F4V3_9CHLO|nr:hypothetical protein PLESTB_001020700 [Pleodorina starrii]GLC65489.1 hypothetical protein PLESTF_000298900 [Pleodorina starrii]